MLVSTMTSQDLEYNADRVKTLVLSALTREGILSSDVADEWCKTHTIIIRPRNLLFRTLQKIMDKDDGELTFVIVKLV